MLPLESFHGQLFRAVNSAHLGPKQVYRSISSNGLMVDICTILVNVDCDSIRQFLSTIILGSLRAIGGTGSGLVRASARRGHPQIHRGARSAQIIV